jgi:PhnB protein
MTKRSLADQLNDALDARVFAAHSRAEADPALELLTRIAQDLRLRPAEQFKDRLKSEISGKGTAMTTATATSSKGVRPGFHTITPYLIVADAPAVVEFAKQAFGATEVSRNFGSAGGYHCEAQIGDSMLMIGGGGEGSAWKGIAMPTSLHIYVPDVDEAYRRALDGGAVSLYAPMDQPYGDRDCGMRDAGGNLWFIASSKTGDNAKGLHTVTPGYHAENASRFIDFLQRAFDATTEARHEDPSGRIMHAKLRIGDSVLEIGEAHGQWQPMPSAMYLYVDNADAWFNRAVEAGAKVIYPLADQGYGDRSGGVQDEWGNHWYIGSHLGDAK